MSPLEIVGILALTGWAIYRQTKVSELSLGPARFKMAIIYAVVGLAFGGFDLPKGLGGWLMIVSGLALSFVVGLVRGHFTKVWAADGKLFSQGTVLTVGLFLGLVAVKFALGTLAYFLHIDDGAGFGEVLIMIAIMIAVQAQIVFHRASAISPVRADTTASA